MLFLGTSRMEKAFSTPATADWFSAASARYYLMGFSYGEHVSFAEALLGKMHPRASVYVIDVEDFFDPILTPPAQTVLYDPKARSSLRGETVLATGAAAGLQELFPSFAAPRVLLSARVKPGHMTWKARRETLSRFRLTTPLAAMWLTVTRLRQ